MKHDTQTRDWLAVDAHTVEPTEARQQHSHRRPRHTIFSALAFNFCLVVFALASAAAFLIITRDRLYTYAYSDAGARVVAQRVEKLNGSLIQLDFDRQQLWDDLIANELSPSRPDVAAARGFLLSARGMLPENVAGQLSHQLPGNATDAQIEDAALDLLTPGTRARYEQAVPLLSRGGLRPSQVNYVAGPAEFQTMAQSIVTEPESDTLQFVLTGFRLNLAGVFTPRMAEGAAVLLDAKSRNDYPPQFGAEIAALIEASLRTQSFRQVALTNASSEEHAGDFANAAPAFTSALDAERAAAAKIVLDKLGAMSIAASHLGATALISHAQSLRDLPRLLLVAEAARDRAAAAAKRLPRDGRLLNAARGDLTINRDLAIAITIAALAFLGALFVVSMMGWRATRRAMSRLTRDDDYHDDSELIDIGGVRGF
ncbi:MAG: hypothetical protein QM759_05895 [Terricaulis sp.]